MDYYDFNISDTLTFTYVVQIKRMFNSYINIIITQIQKRGPNLYSDSICSCNSFTIASLLQARPKTSCSAYNFINLMKTTASYEFRNFHFLI